MFKTNSIRLLSATPTDIDATNFIEAAQLINPVHIDAITKLVSDLKTANVWGKMKAIYPVVGGTSFTHKFNLKNPSAFSLQFIGSPVHNSSGISWDGVSQYANTGFIPASHFSATSHISYYSRTFSSNGSDPLDMGAFNSGNQALMLIGGYPGDKVVTRHCSDYTITNSPAKGRGWYLSTNDGLATSSSPIYENGVIIGQNVGNGVYPDIPIYIGCLNLYSSAYGFVNRQCAFVTIGDNLTASEALVTYNAIQTYQTSLNRQI